MISFGDFINEGDDTRLQSIDIIKVSDNITDILKSFKLNNVSVAGKYQPVMGRAELVFNIYNVSINKTKLKSFAIIYTSNGDIIANASSDTTKHLIRMPIVGNIKSEQKLYSKTGLLNRILQFTIDEISDSMSEK
ncbi:MAG: hypothetical protein R8M45_04395 [Ghiorsea sp.]